VELIQGRDIASLEDSKNICFREVGISCHWVVASSTAKRKIKWTAEQQVVACDYICV
jgi:hypothetical protein